MVLPRLYSIDSFGHQRIYDVWSEGDVLKTQTGIVGGAAICSQRRIEGTNLGKRNATTAEEQAALYAERKHRDLIKYGGWSTDPNAPKPTAFGPMLAQKYEGGSVANAGNQIAMQPKLDGMRCFAYLDTNNDVVLFARSGNAINFPHVAQELKLILRPGMIFDGELYCHGKSFNEVISLIKRYRDDSKVIAYHVYDLAAIDGESEISYFNRQQRLNSVISPNETVNQFGSVKNVQTELVQNNERDIREAQALFVGEGYEGAMIRVLEAPYEMQQRPDTLLKVKTFMDAEFIVSSIEQGQGNMEGKAMFICDTDNGRQFRCAMNAPMAKQAWYYEHREKFIHRLLTVKFFELSEYGVPRFPRALRFRGEE